MAAGSNLLDNVFFKAEVDEKVVSDLVGSLESELTGSGRGNSAVRVQAAANHFGNTAVGGNSNVQDNKIGLSQELAKPGTCVQGGVISTASEGSTMDAATGTTATGTSVTAWHIQSKTGTFSDALTAVSDHRASIEKISPTGVQTLNESSVLMNSQNCENVTTLVVNNGPGVETKGNAVLPSSSSTVIQTSLMQNAVPPTVVSPLPSVLNCVPTVTLVRPPMQTPGTVTSLSRSSNTFLTTSVNVSQPAMSGAQISNLDSSKTTMQTTSPVTTPSVVMGAAAALGKSQVLQNVRTSIVAAAIPGGISAIAPPVLAPRHHPPQQNTPNIQNIQLPPGMVLVRNENGQLLMIHQQTLAQMQAQAQSQSAMTPRPAPTCTPSAQISSVQSAVMLGGAAATPALAPVQPGLAAALTQRAGTPGAAGTSGTPAASNVTETMENVKKCKNFLSTLIKLASSGKQSAETTANVKQLVKSLLEGQIEVEDFTSRLYQELNSSPQPYLVPFLKRSLPALRQMTPDSTAFIQQSQLPQASVKPASSSVLTAVVLGGTSLGPRLPQNSSTTSDLGAKGTPLQSQRFSLAHMPQSKPGMMVPQQQGAMTRPRVTLAQLSVVPLRGQPNSGFFMGQPHGVTPIQTVSVVKQTQAPGTKVTVGPQSTAFVAQKNKLKEAGGGTFKDDDDINDVASMAGVNLSEESARILATNSELVGSVTRSCKDEAFLYTPSLTRRVQEIGRRFGVTDLGPEVVNYVSHATQQRLRDLLEKASEVALQKNLTLKEDQKYDQASDVRAQLRFLEQLDHMEKQRKEEQEREMLMKAAKSRSRQEDPEQLRLKQKAKEMQQQELNQIRQREANMTALAAIGPRRRRKMDAPLSGAPAEGPGSGPSSSCGSHSRGSRTHRQRITRVNLRDLLFCLENERESSRSHLLYRGFLK